MENKLEQLLNSLVKDGWNPRGYKMQGIHCSNNRFTLYLPNMIQGNYSIRDLVSKSSGLWQFVCENGMIEHKGLDIHSWEHTTAEHSDFWFTDGDNYEYYIIESSLKDESELESFILYNIKVDVDSKGG